jgi:hypothetical protein
MARQTAGESIIAAFEAKAAGEQIIAAVLMPKRPPVNEEDDFPRAPMSWQEACEYIRIADNYDDPMPVAWTKTRVLMPIAHEMSTNNTWWCFSAPRDPAAFQFAQLYDCDDPEKR